jgi:hypothetical protein
MANTVTESIYSGKTCVVALAEVQHCEKLWATPKPPYTLEPKPNGLHVITSKTRYDVKNDVWANPIYIGQDEADAFLRVWCAYRGELESDTLADLRPDAAERLKGGGE